jgi:TetR/AcrR family transcriptional regulator
MPKKPPANTMAQPSPTDDQPRRARGRPKSAPGPEDASVGPEALIELTCKLLDEIPPSDVTRIAIARAANVHPRLILYYFRNRDTLIGAAAQKLSGRLRSLNTRAEEGPPVSVFERLRGRVANLFRFKLRHPYYHRLMMEEVATSEDAETRDYFVTQNEAVLDFYRKTIAKGVESGELRAVNPAFLYATIIGMCEVYVTGERLLAALGVDRDDKATQDAYAAFIEDMVVRMLQP